ncbi:hypothetical protein P170DRAFT_474269 [Aspergillus steynii IBT 23096]|uniref:Uncharacterized protein n=1 Tax=Aspergillus steynii IBT 23096 TaxID=1392250 RepID=A0A2I2GCW0_9EURO|nr:uncharacterized protein P170DRAFT_474269 [Aspergillus steynii IBT 23096]PLB50710.1 hypothetical protein P170DRAFT_474269 [Aspergillus steynii IBT 23096]
MDESKVPKKPTFPDRAFSVSGARPSSDYLSNGGQSTGPRGRSASQSTSLTFPSRFHFAIRVNSVDELHRSDERVFSSLSIPSSLLHPAFVPSSEPLVFFAPSNTYRSTSSNTFAASPWIHCAPPFTSSHQPSSLCVLPGDLLRFSTGHISALLVSEFADAAVRPRFLDSPLGKTATSSYRPPPRIAFALAGTARATAETWSLKS